jgi:nucleotide-binding universal stress UspA family protein
MHILTPVDGSKPSLRAVELAAKLTNGLNSKLTILAVHQFIVGRKVTAEVQSQEDVDLLLKNSRSTAMSFGLNDVTTVELKSREVAHTIVDYAEKNGIDLIVMGAAGLGKVKSFVIGSVSAAVLRKSACPVTIVH